MKVDGRAWPGFSIRQCPVCAQMVGTHREPTNDERGEVVVYHQHDDTMMARRPWRRVRTMCIMSGKQAAIAAVAFTGRGR